MYFEILKAIAYTLILAHLGVFGQQASVIYLFGTVLLTILSPEAMMVPEKVLFVIYILLLAHILVWRTQSSKKELIKRNLLDIVLVLTFSSAVLALLSYSKAPKAASYLILLIAMMFVTGLVEKKTKIFLSIMSAAAIAYFFAHGTYASGLGVIAGGIIYSIFFIAYRLAFEVFSRDCRLADLKPGMIPLEFVWVEKNSMRRCRFFEGVFYTLKNDKGKYITSPLSSLSPINIEALKNVGKAFGSDSIKVQALVDMRPYVLAGILLTFLYAVLIVMF